MSYTFHLLTAQANILPASYPLTVTASQTGLSPFSTTLTITVTAHQVPTVDTVRSITELLTVTWRDGQAARQLTAQDCRDTIVSLALQRADFSRLPRSITGLPAGRAWVDSNGVVKVNV